MKLNYNQICNICLFIIILLCIMYYIKNNKTSNINNANNINNSNNANNINNTNKQIESFRSTSLNSVTYDSGESSIWIPPLGVKQAKFTVIGAKGGNGNGFDGKYSIGGNGAIVSTTINVASNQKYYIYVGKNGIDNKFNQNVIGGENPSGNMLYNGGDSGIFSGSGGASSIVSLEQITPNTRMSNPIIVAGGGGGGGDYGSNGGSGCINNEGDGGDGLSHNTNGGGSGGIGGNINSISNDKIGYDASGNGGGGGGSGYYVGGGGRGGDKTKYAGGGGGGAGSSYVMPNISKSSISTSNTSYSTDVNGIPLIKIEWENALNNERNKNLDNYQRLIDIDKRMKTIKNNLASLNTENKINKPEIVFY